MGQYQAQKEKRIKKGKLFSKLSMMITVAAREGGDDRI